jgi:hypothetical protein
MSRVAFTVARLKTLFCSHAENRNTPCALGIIGKNGHKGLHCPYEPGMLDVGALGTS